MFFQNLKKASSISEAQFWDSFEKIGEEEAFKIDAFYLDCQRYRHNYHGSYGKIHCPKTLNAGKCGIKLDRALALMTLSYAGNMDYQPTFPLIRNFGMIFGSFPTEPKNSECSNTCCPQWIFVKCVPTYVMDLIAIGIYAVLNFICT